MLAHCDELPHPWSPTGGTMEELFRFSVIRAASRSNAPTVSLKHPGQGAAGGGDALDTFQEQLRTIVQNGVAGNAPAKTIWQNLEPVALQYVLKEANTILAYVLWKMLHDVLDYIRQALYV